MIVDLNYFKCVKSSWYIFNVWFQGDEIILLKRVDDNWYEGERNGQIGILPVNYVKVI